MYTSIFADAIRREIIDAGIDDRFKAGAYEFVLHGFEFYKSRLAKERQIGGQELALGLLAFAHRQYGLMAKSVFDHWGVRTTDDLGSIVSNMIKTGMMSRQSSDSLDDFYDVADIGDFFKLAQEQCFNLPEREKNKKI